MWKAVKKTLNEVLCAKRALFKCLAYGESALFAHNSSNSGFGQILAEGKKN